MNHPTVGSSQLLVDPDRTQPTAGEPLNLTCYFIGRLNGTEGPMRWLKNGEVLVATNMTESGSRRAVLQLDGLASSHSGVYTCEMMVDGVILQESAHVIVTGRSITEPFSACHLVYCLVSKPSHCPGFEYAKMRVREEA